MSGRARYSKEQYVDFAKRAILDLLRQEHAVTWAEAQAKIADRRWESVPTPINPHHMTTAKQELRRDGRITETAGATIGSQTVSVIHLRDTRGISSYVADASAHKRSLSASFNAWATPNRDRPGGLLGPAGEIVANRSLQEAAGAGVGYLLLGRDRGEVRNVFGQEVPGGALDNAAFLQVMGPDGMPRSIFLPIEVKNVRHWIYPRSKELHQLLHKAALLQSEHRDQPIAPVLICRKKSVLAYWMSIELGFRIVETNRQYLLPHADVQPHILQAVRDDLGFTDLVQTTDADPTIVGVFKDSVPGEARGIADRWAICGPELVDYFAELRKDDLSDEQRDAWLRDLKETVTELPGCRGRW
jgi:hypothetical protein